MEAYRGQSLGTFSSRARNERWLAVRRTEGGEERYRQQQTREEGLMVVVGGDGVRWAVGGGVVLAAGHGLVLDK